MWASFAAIIVASLLPITYFVLYRVHDLSLLTWKWRNFEAKQEEKNTQLIKSWDSIGRQPSELEKLGRSLGPLPDSLIPGYQDSQENLFKAMGAFEQRPSTWTVRLGSVFLVVGSFATMELYCSATWVSAPCN